ncbi:MAG: oligosaccharide flippase family protein [Saprospiraceae bacterium]|nr:oligosaccharide flippase family protein [Saprospiraceae bacterium]MDZ4705459.1 oligosaccharide flippase family protein [Saprospiraceae bacterium]
MGIIQRQSIILTVINYIGVALGAVNTLIIYPKILSEEEFGIFRFVTQTAQMLFPFALLGAGSLTIRFFPHFKDERNGHNGFLLLLLSAASGGLALFSILAFLLRKPILAGYASNFGEYAQYLPYIIPIVCFMGLAFVLNAYSTNFQRMAVPQVLNNIFLKLSTALLCICLFNGMFAFSTLMAGVVLAYFIVFILMSLYLNREGLLFLKFNPAFFKKPLLKSMAGYAVFGFLGHISSSLAIQIDTFMVGTMLDLKSVAAFSIGLFIADTIDIPRRSVESAASPIVAQAWKDNNLGEIQNIYRKSSLIQLLAGLFILLGIWLSVDELFEIMPNGEKYEVGKYVILILGIGKLTDLATGINSPLIGYSAYYRFNFYAILALALLNILANLLFIPIFQINGAALATMFSLGLFNLLKLGYIYYRWRMHPFTWAAIWVFVIGAVSFLVAWFMPATAYPLVNIIIKSITFAGIYVGLTLWFRISSDLSGLFDAFLKKLRNR